MSDPVNGSASSPATAAQRPQDALVPAQRGVPGAPLPAPDVALLARLRTSIGEGIPWAPILLSAIFLMVVLGSVYSYLIEHG